MQATRRQQLNIPRVRMFAGLSCCLHCEEHCGCGFLGCHECWGIEALIACEHKHSEPNCSSRIVLCPLRKRFCSRCPSRSVFQKKVEILLCSSIPAPESRPSFIHAKGSNCNSVFLESTYNSATLTHLETTDLKTKSMESRGMHYNCPPKPVPRF